MTKPKAIVVGAGLGGLSAAAYLLSHGFSVTVIEKNASLGGKMGEVREHGFRFDTGPSLVTMPFVIDDLFRALGKNTDEFLKLIKLEVICRYFFADGKTLDASSDLNTFAAAVSEISRKDAAALPRYLAYSQNIYDLTAPVFLEQSIHEFASLLNFKTIRALFSSWRLDAWRSVHKANASFFSSPKLRQVFDRYATYSGSNPYAAPATLNVIPHVEYTLGSYYIDGGLYRLVDALERVLKEWGVLFQLNSPVRKVIVENGKTEGVQLESSEIIKANAVIVNADAVYAAQQLVPELAVSQKRTELEPSCSGLVFLWGVRRTYPQLEQHNIFFSSNYEQEFKEIFSELAYPSDPTIYISVTSRRDSDHAPDGCDNLFVLINAPFLTNQNLHLNIERIKERIISKLEAAGLDDLRAHIIFEKILSPRYFQDSFNSYCGSIYGLSSNSKWNTFLRPANRSRLIKGLYFAGGAAHPGGGIPLVIRSGKIAAELASKNI